MKKATDQWKCHALCPPFRLSPVCAAAPGLFQHFFALVDQTPVGWPTGCLAEAYTIRWPPHVGDPILFYVARAEDGSNPFGSVFSKMSDSLPGPSKVDLGFRSVYTCTGVIFLPAYYTSCGGKAVRQSLHLACAVFRL